jgi:hypothetical protein
MSPRDLGMQQQNLVTTGAWILAERERNKKTSNGQSSRLGRFYDETQTLIIGYCYQLSFLQFSQTLPWGIK